MKKVLILVSILVLSLLAIGCAKEDTAGQARTVATTAAPATTEDIEVAPSASTASGVCTPEDKDECKGLTDKTNPSCSETQYVYSVSVVSGTVLKNCVWKVNS